MILAAVCLQKEEMIQKNLKVMSTSTQVSSLCILNCPGSIIIVARYVNLRLLLSPAFSFSVNITGVLKEIFLLPVTINQLTSSREALSEHHVTRCHSIFMFS